jgi:hypothetical protein
LVVFGNPYIFVDEIEVYRGDDAYLETPFVGPGIYELETFAPQKYIGDSVKKIVEKDIRAIRASLSSNPVSAELKADISGRLDSAEKALQNPMNLKADELKGTVPFNTFHESIFGIQARLWRALGSQGVTVWQNGLWDPLESIHVPHENSPARVQVDMMQNEYRAGAFNISNALDTDIEVRAEITGLGVHQSCVTVHEAAWVATSQGDGYSFPSMLLEAEKAEGGYRLRIPSGLTRQVWVTFHSEGIPPGRCQGKILLYANGKRFEVPLEMNIYPLSFPERPSLHVGGWDYTNLDSYGGLTPRNRKQIIGHLREHWVDSSWATSSAMPFSRIFDTRLTERETRNFDEWLKRWPDASRYLVFLNVRKQLNGAMMGTPEFNEEIKQWITLWADHIRLNGIIPKQLYLLLVDEPRAAEQDETILQWAKAIHAAGTNVKIWEDLTHEDLRKAIPKMTAVCDEICLNRWSVLASHNMRNYLKTRQWQGVSLAFYSTHGPAVALDPYFYYRLQAWTCWEYGAKASFFWSFVDTGGGSGWNRHSLSRHSYVPFFIDDSSVVAGKHMEAIREGVEDYEYLKMLQDEVMYLEQSCGQCDLLEKAQQLLEEAPKRVSQTQGNPSPYWSEERERESADQIRRDILDMLVKIQNY